MSEHYLQRVDERLVGDEAKKVNAAIAKACAKYGSKSIGIVAHKLSGVRGDYGGWESNGDLVVVIVRNGEPATVYLRRSTQTFDLGVFRTDIGVDMTNTVLRRPLYGRNARRPRGEEPFNPFNIKR